MALHPLADLTAEEVVRVANLVRALHPGSQLTFKAITLEEPDKTLTVRYLEAEHAGRSAPRPSRIAFAAYYIRGVVSLWREGRRSGCVMRDGWC